MSRPRPRATCIHGHKHYLGHWLRPSTASVLTSVTGHVLQLPQALPRSRATSIHGLGPYFVFGWRAGRHHSIVQYRGPQGHGSTTRGRPGRWPTSRGLSGTQCRGGRACQQLASTSVSNSHPPQRMMCPSRVVPLMTRLLIIASMRSSLPHSVDGNNINSTCTSQLPLTRSNGCMIMCTAVEPRIANRYCSTPPENLAVYCATTETLSHDSDSLSTNIGMARRSIEARTPGDHAKIAPQVHIQGMCE